MTWAVAGSDIIAAIGGSGDTSWADDCAAAINAAIATRLNGYVVVAASDAEAELTRAAVLDGVAAYRDRDAPYGVLSLGPDGAIARVGADVIRAAGPAIARYALPGMA